MEGQDAAVEAISGLFCSIGNEVCRIDGAKKAKYHAAASILSNQVIAVLDMGYTLLEDCGFTRAEAVRATGQLVMRNIENVLEAGCDGALTGPIERNDIETVKKHIACMQNDDSDDVSLYKMRNRKWIRMIPARTQKEARLDSPRGAETILSHNLTTRDNDMNGSIISSIQRRSKLKLKIIHNFRRRMTTRNGLSRHSECETEEKTVVYCGV